MEVLTGPDKGKQGYINYVVQERNWVCVEGLNVKYKSMGQDDEFPGYMYKEELPLTVTEDIMLGNMQGWSKSFIVPFTS